MWLALTLLLVAAGVALHFGWARRYQAAKRDLEERNRALADLSEQHEQLTRQKQAERQALFNSMTEGVLVLDAEGRIQLANQSLQQLFRLSKDVRGMTIMEAFRLQELAEVIRRLQQERTVSGFELELPGIDERWLQVNAAAVLDHDGYSRISRFNPPQATGKHPPGIRR
jgi:two-component system, OmpR family, phosphate regulon sensor histidine kinase PhoR